jgi:hypothetical protein
MKKLAVLIAFALALAGGEARSQTYNLFKPANGVLKGSTSTYVTTAAASIDIKALWSGTCDATTFLRGDGACSAVPGATGGTVTSVALTVPGIFSVGGSPITTSGTLAISAVGTSGGIPYFNSSSALASTAALTANALVLGGGAGGTPTVVGSLGTTTTLLHGNASGAPTFGAASLTADVTGTLPVGSGGTGIASGTSGGVPYFSGSTTVASSAALTQYALVIGGGAGATPAVVSGLGTTTQVLHGNASAAPSFTALVAGDLPSNTKVRSFGTTFGDTGGSALTSGSVVYFTVPYSCTISAWNATVDAGTVTFDVWKIATGTAIPTVTNTITASALPAISTGTALHSTTLTSWTTSVAANDIVGIQLKTVATAKYAELDVECDQ